VAGGGQSGYKLQLQILALHVLNAAQRIFGIPDFRYYALADGIKAILSKGGRGIMPTKTQQGGRFPPTVSLVGLFFWGNSWALYMLTLLQ